MHGRKKHIFVGLSGGVDSSVAAYLLQRAKHKITAVMMKNWQDADNQCSLAEDESHVTTVCEQLGIELEVIDLSAEYEDRVFQIMLDELQEGLTPNPDILCNQEIKFKALLDHASARGADFLATGHYASLCSYKRQLALHSAVDSSKDQTYFLSRLPKNAISQILFPLGRIHKTKVRSLADQIQLPNANKKDSTGICFVGKRKYRDFISQYLLDKPGHIVDEHGKSLGEHRGLFFYTIGQRKGLEIGGLDDRTEEPWFVASKNRNSNELLVVQGSNHPLLFSKRLRAGRMHWFAQPTEKHFTCHAKIRHGQALQACQVTVSSDMQTINVNFATAQRAITPGQYIAIYSGPVVLGNGQIQASTADNNH